MTHTCQMSKDFKYVVPILTKRISFQALKF